MRIAFLTQPWAQALPPSESVAIWTQELATRLAAAGHEVSVWSRDREGSGQLRREDGVAYRFVRGRGDHRLERALRRLDRARPVRRPLFASPSYHGIYHAEVVRALRRERPDVVHVPTFSQLVRPLRLACPGTTVVLHVRDEMTGRLPPSLLRRRLPRAHAVVGCSEFVSRALGDACPSANVLTIPNGVDIARFVPPRERPAGEAVRLLYVGRISPEKGTHLLFEAFASLAGTTPVELDVVGEEAVPPPDMLALLGGPEVREQPASGYLEASLARLPADARARIRLHGKRPHGELPGFYRRADVLVVPSLSEGFGKPAAEAMASGLPVVAARAGGIPEVVADGETGLLVPPNDPAALAEAVARVAADPALRARLGAAGRTRAEEHFSYDRIAREVEALDEELSTSQ